MAIINISRKVLNKNVVIAIAPSPYPLLQTDHLLLSSKNSEKQPFISLSTRDTSLILVVLFLASTFFFLFLFSVYIRRFSSPQAIEISRTRRQRQQHRNQQEASSSSSSTSTTQAHGLDILVIQSLPAFAWKEVEEQEESIDCSVCLSQFEEKESVKVIPYCGHLFHTECIDKWLLSNVSCPLCRSIQLFPSNNITVQCFDVESQPLDHIQIEARDKSMLTCPHSSPS